jgi:hypothetical protein
MRVNKSVSRLVWEILKEYLSKEEKDIIDELLESPIEIPNFKPISREKLHER